jgi:hypothetical protein
MITRRNRHAGRIKIGEADKCLPNQCFDQTTLVSNPAFDTSRTYPSEY